MFAQTFDSQDWYKHPVSVSVFEVKQISIELVDDGRAWNKPWNKNTSFRAAGLGLNIKKLCAIFFDSCLLFGT